MDFEMIAVKCKHWDLSSCPQKDKYLLSALLLGIGHPINSSDIIYADNICKTCTQFEEYRIK